MVSFGDCLLHTTATVNSFNSTHCDSRKMEGLILPTNSSVLVQNQTETCFPDDLASGNVCTVWTGRTRLFVSDADSIEAAANLAMAEIENIINSQAFVDRVETGLVHADFLEALEDDYGPITGGTPTTISNGGSLGLTSVVLVTVAGAALVVMVGSFYVYRRNYGRTNASSAATQAAGSSLNHSNNNSSFAIAHGAHNGRPTSPYSSMVSDAYQFNENMSILSGGQSGMSAILEGENTYRCCTTPRSRT